jgi:adenylate kinase family enzyme
MPSDDGTVSASGSSCAVVMTGVPGAGKTTLGRSLAQVLEVPFLALDDIKERHFESSDGGLDALVLRIAAETDLGDALAAVAATAVVDIWIQPGRDTTRVRQLLAANSSRVIEIMCRVPADVAVDRYRRRVRSGPHKPPDAETLQRIREAAAAVTPLGLGPSIEVDTSGPVDLDALVAVLRRCRP